MSLWSDGIVTYRIHSNKRPGRLDKPFWVGAYLF